MASQKHAIGVGHSNATAPEPIAEPTSMTELRMTETAGIVRAPNRTATARAPNTKDATAPGGPNTKDGIELLAPKRKEPVALLELRTTDAAESLAPSKTAMGDSVEGA
jgi:hypothetical protein